MAAIKERFVVYFSKDDGCWLAHGLHTDEIGTGDCVVDAVADLMKAIDQIAKLADREGDIEVYREAPEDIQRKAKAAKPLPREIYEIAHRRARGQWPKDFKVHVDTSKNKRYMARIPEVAASK